jgi:hypothetical protein
VEEHDLMFLRVGLLVNEPPGIPGYSLSSLPNTAFSARRRSQDRAQTFAAPSAV